jgi:hypothetical protein
LEKEWEAPCLRENKNVGEQRHSAAVLTSASSPAPSFYIGYILHKVERGFAPGVEKNVQVNSFRNLGEK